MNNDYNSTPEFPMKWHKFVIYVVLWLNALVSVGNVVTYGLGLHYGGYADQVYRVYDDLRIIDLTMATCCIALAVYAIKTRSALARFEAMGPKMLIRLHVLSIAFSIGYLLLACGITELPLSDLVDSSTFSSIASSVAVAYYNHNYYAKRASLFVN